MKLKYAAVLPAIDPVLAHCCVRSMHSDIRRNLLLIDNTGLGRIGFVHRPLVAETMVPNKNLGVPVSWNEGVGFAKLRDAEYLIIVSQSVQFGRQQGVDFLAHLERTQPSVLSHSQLGWHLLAIHRDVFDQVGVFDPVFTPGYYEEQDFMWRMHLAGLPSPRANGGKFDQIQVDVDSAGDALTLQRGLVEVDMGEQLKTFKRKWGGEDTPQRWDLWDHPYNDSHLGLQFVGSYVKQRTAKWHP